MESPEGMYTRVAKALAQVEQRYGAAPSSVRKLEEDFYDVRLAAPLSSPYNPR